MPNLFPTPSEVRNSCLQERRRRERLQLSLPVYVRRLDYSDAEIATTVDLTRHGLRFTTSKVGYSPGMGLLLTFPYSPANSSGKEYLGEIVRVDDLGEHGRAVAVQFHPPASD